MISKTRKNKVLSRMLVALIAIAMVFTTAPLNMGSQASAADKLVIKEPALVVTGQALVGDEYTKDNIGLEKAYSAEELVALQGTGEQKYTGINSVGSKLYTYAQGVFMSALLPGIDFVKTQETIYVKSSDGRTVSFSNKAKYNNGNVKSTGLANRYWYDGFNSSKKKEAPAMLAWAMGQVNGESSAPDAWPTKMNETDGLLLCIGQTNIDDVNQSLFNKDVKLVQAGDEIIETALTIGDKKMTRADILSLPYAEKTYSYDTQLGKQTDNVKGIPMSVLLEGYDDGDVVDFNTADDYPITGKTVGELIEENYMLAYEKNGEAIYSEAKSDASKKGYFSLYGGAQPVKMVNYISVTGSGGIDFSKSPYKHITNGGQPGDGPFNIDGITGATLTVEGPAVEKGVPVSVKELEGKNGGCRRGVYFDTRDGKSVKRMYEGIDLSYFLHKMTAGTNGVVITDTASKVVIKNRNRQPIAELSIADIDKMSADGEPALIAYGTAFENESEPTPFVFDGASGKNASLGNEDGCLKFVYNLDKYGDQNGTYKTFGNMAYVYIEEETAPGYKHDTALYNTPENNNYILSVTGSEVGRQLEYTTKDLEDLVEYDSEGNISKDNKYGYRDNYGLANSTYWYVNEYEGVKLWSLLQASGVKASKASDNTEKMVRFHTRDEYAGAEEFSFKQVADPNMFGLYEKNVDDLGDGSYEPVPSDCVKKGFPILVAYGVNRYPYIINETDNGYKKGLENNDGPLKIIFGKEYYAHKNGSSQVKSVDTIIAGSDEYNYSTHAYHSDNAYKDLADNTIKVIIKSKKNGKIVTTGTKKFSVADIEKLSYEGKKAERNKAKVKAAYETKSGLSYESNIYEGVSLSYFLKEVVSLQGSKGTITFKNASGKSLKVDLKTALTLTKGYNKETGIKNLKPVLAFAKNGSPLVADKNSAGYEGTLKLAEGTAFAQDYKVENAGGPLSIVFPRKSSGAKATLGSLGNITSITINVTPDSYAHINKPYSSYSKSKIKIYGAGTELDGVKTYTVSQLEGKQSLATTKTYSIKNSRKGKRTQIRYRGIKLYDLLTSSDIGLKSNAKKIIVRCADGSKYTISRGALQDSSKYKNTISGAKNLPVMLAFGSATKKIKSTSKGKALVKSTKSKGYSKSYKNSGGPLKLVIGQTKKSNINGKKCVKNVKSIEVTASGSDSWNHSSADVYKPYLKETIKLEIVDNDSKELWSKDYTVGELEARTDLVYRDNLNTTELADWEGIKLWDFLNQETAGKASGLDNPISVTLTAGDGYPAELIQKIGLENLQKGIVDNSRDYRVPVILAYGTNGSPLVDSNKSEGYESTAKNSGGPIRLIVHSENNEYQGACVQDIRTITIKVNGSALQAAGDELSAQSVDENSKCFDEYPGNGKAENLPLSGIRSTSMDKDGNLWIGTYGGGLVQHVKGQESFTVYNSDNTAMKNSTVSSAAIDSNGGVWFTQNPSHKSVAGCDGVAYMKDGKVKHFRDEDNPATVPSQYCSDIQIDKDGNVWFGCIGGLTKYDPAKDEWTTYDEGFPASKIKKDILLEQTGYIDNMEFDGKGGIWCGFYPDCVGGNDGKHPYVGGFAYFKDGKVVHSYPYTSEKEVVDPADENGWWYRLQDVWVRDIAVDQNGGIWVVASSIYGGMKNIGGKVYYMSSTDAKPVEYSGFGLFGEDAFSTNSELRMVTVDPDGGLWFGTSKDGLFYVKDATIKGGKLELTANYSSKNGDWEAGKYDNVYCLDIYGKTVYSGTSDGMVVKKFDFQNSTGDPDGIITHTKSLKKPSISSVKAGSKQLTLTWKKDAAADGYKIYRATKANGKYKLVKTVSSNKTVKWTNKKLTKGKKYYYKVKSFKTSYGEKLTSSFSGYKSGKAK